MVRRALPIVLLAAALAVGIGLAARGRPGRRPAAATATIGPAPLPAAPGPSLPTATPALPTSGSAAPAGARDTGPAPTLPTTTSDAAAPVVVPVETRFQGEARSARWAAATEATLRRNAHQLGATITVDSVECRASICRLVVGAADTAQLTGVIVELDRHRDLDTGSSSVLLVGPEETPGHASLALFFEFDSRDPSIASPN